VGNLQVFCWCHLGFGLERRLPMCKTMSSSLPPSTPRGTSAAHFNVHDVTSVHHPSSIRNVPADTMGLRPGE
jgi:hypothetical protein